MSRQRLLGVVIIIVVGAVILGGTLTILALKKKNNATRQAVFLTNGQVYFGYVTQTDDKTLTLRDIYYLQVQPPLQPQGKDQPSPQPQFNLVKLGSEWHGPTDEMVISLQNILFREKIKSDSNVNRLIAEYQKNSGKLSTPLSQTAPPTLQTSSQP